MGRPPPAGMPACPPASPGARRTILTPIWRSIVLRGPRPLDFYTVRIENGGVDADTRQRLQRTALDASQVTVA